MPQFDLCSNDATCPLAKACDRSVQSGTKPSRVQSWCYFLWTEDASCTGFVPILRRGVFREEVRAGA